MKTNLGLKSFFTSAFASLVTGIDWVQLFYGAILFVIGFIVLRIFIFVTIRLLRRRLTAQGTMLVRKIMSYSGMTILIILTLNQLGVSLAALLGAAGIAGIAIGFAAQTSISNLISGVFLISEKSFEMGDLLKVGDTVGIVVDIELLAVKLRSFDNRYIRIPNEVIIKTEIQNITHYPIRRIDLDLSVAYGTNLEHVGTVLKEIAKNNPFCLDEPEALIVIGKFGDSGIFITFGVWCVKEDFLKLKNSIMLDVYNRFQEEGIVIPLPQLVLHDLKEPAAGSM